MLSQRYCSLLGFNLCSWQVCILNIRMQLALAIPCTALSLYFHLRESTPSHLFLFLPQGHFHKSEEWKMQILIQFASLKKVEILEVLRPSRTVSRAKNRVRSWTMLGLCFPPEASALYHGNWSLRLLSLFPFTSMNNHVLIY